jgi:hypothetical protein
MRALAFADVSVLPRTTCRQSAARSKTSGRLEKKVSKDERSDQNGIGQPDKKKEGEPKMDEDQTQRLAKAQIFFLLVCRPRSSSRSSCLAYSLA